MKLVKKSEDLPNNEYKAREARMVLLLPVLYFLNNLTKEITDCAFLKYYFNDMIGGAFLYILLVWFIREILKCSLNRTHFFAFILVLLLGSFWEYFSLYLFTNTTFDILDILAYMILPCYYYINNLWREKWTARFLK